MSKTFARMMVVAVMAGTLASHAARLSDHAAPALGVTINTVSLSQLDDSGFSAAIDLTTIANQDVKLRSVTFDSATINGVPIRINPLSGPIELKKGRAAEGLSTLEVRVKFRELSSFDPLREIVNDGTAKVHATVRAQIELSLFEKLAILTAGPWVVTEIDQRVPVRLPGGMLGKTVALAALSAAEPIWIWGQAGREWRRNQSTLAKDAKVGLDGSLVRIEATYDLKSRDGETETLHGSAMGFLVGGGKIITTLEAIEPWSFTPSVTEAVGDHEVSVVRDRVEIVASLIAPNGTIQTASMQHGELKIVKTGHDKQTALSLESNRKYSIGQRASENNVAILEAAGWRAFGQGAAIASAASGDDWAPAAVYRTPSGGGDELKPFLWLTEARLERDHFVLKDPVDSTALGSPVWIGDGVAGLLQTEDTATEVHRVLKRFK